MKQTHPITPPPELIEQWREEWEALPQRYPGTCQFRYVATQAARWGADQELEACCEHMRDHQWGFVERPDGTMIHRAVYLQQSRRPKPPSLKEQALGALGRFNSNAHTRADEMAQDFDLIRRALEAQ